MKYGSPGLFSAELVPAVNYPRIIYGSRTKICVTGPILTEGGLSSRPSSREDGAGGPHIPGKMGPGGPDRRGAPKFYDTGAAKRVMPRPVCREYCERVAASLG